jgi:low affinity Fe/Cu permease
MNVKNITKWIGTPASLIVHSLFFVGIFSLRLFNVGVQDILLILTTVVSLEAIYLSIFIQMTINLQSEHLKDVKRDIEEMQEDIEDIQEDIEEDIEEDLS